MQPKALKMPEFPAIHPTEGRLDIKYLDALCQLLISLDGQLLKVKRASEFNTICLQMEALKHVIYFHNNR